MSYKPPFPSASFRQVPFHIRSTSDTTGETTVVNRRSDGKDNVQKSGTHAAEFSMECFVCGVNYLAERDALKIALLEPGEGELIHPYYGTRMVTVKGQFTTSHSVAEGGMCRIQVTFVEAVPRQYPVAKTVTRDSAKAEAAAAMHRLEAWFEWITNLNAAQQYVAESVSNDVRTFMEKVEDWLLPRSLDVTEAREALRALRHELPALLLEGDGKGLGQRMVTILTSSLRQLSDAQSLMDTVRPFLHYVIADDNGWATTPAREQQKTTKQAMQSLIRSATWASAVSVSASLDFVRYRDPLQLRDELDDYFQQSLSEQAMLWPVYQAMMADLTERSKRLGRLVTRTPTLTEPVQVTAYRYYGDLEKIETVLANNDHIHHPSYVPGGEPVELLSPDIEGA